MRLIHLIPLLLITLACSCRKDPPEPITMRFIPAEMRAYWDFKPGTYWIYKDSLSGAIDSVYVTARYTDTAQGILNYTQEPIIYEYLEFNTHSSLDDHDYSYWINTQAGLQGYNEFNSVRANKSGIDTHVSFVYPLVSGNYLGQSYGVDIDTCIIKAVVSNYIGYEKTVVIVNTLNSFEGLNHTRSYFAKNVGLVRYEVPDSNKYRTLIDYHIEP